MHRLRTLPPRSAAIQFAFVNISNFTARRSPVEKKKAKNSDGMKAVYFIFALCQLVDNVQINYIRVPHALKNNSGKSAILDCNYSVRPDDTELVVKWYLNNELVYQWVPPQKPQSLGILKNRVDLNYRASGDPKAVFRAMKIANPTSEIAGEYKCFVSTFADEDFSVKNLIIFVPEKSLYLFKSNCENGKINFTCLATEVYPQAHLLLYMDKKLHQDGNVLEPVEWSTKKHEDGKYSLLQTSTTKIDKLDFGSLIFCELRIPGTGYVKRQTLLYYPEGKNRCTRKFILIQLKEVMNI